MFWTCDTGAHTTFPEGWGWEQFGLFLQVKNMELSIIIVAPRKLVLSTLFIAAPRIYWVDLDISTSLVHFLAVFALFSGIYGHFGV